MQQKFVTEIRFVPQPQFIDIRGKVVAAISSEKFSEWRVSKDRVDVGGEEGLIFASYTNCGFITLKKDNIEVCLERIDEFLKIIDNFPPIRWGVRIYSITENNKKFSALVKEYKEKLLNFNPKNFSKVQGTLEDIGISYIFKNDKDKYHITTGPMEKEQAVQFFPADTLPDRGIFVDLDIYREGSDFYKDDFRRARILNFIRTSFLKGEEIINQLFGTLK